MKIDTTDHFYAEADLETARAIVKRCGIRDGLFKGPRTQNAVESIAYALSTVRKEARAAAFEEMIAAIAVLPPQGTMNYRRGYEEGVRDALRTLEAAASSVPSEGEVDA